MGAYVNPPGMSKEKWLAENSIPVEGELNWAKLASQGYLPVVLVNNGPFTAAAIAYSEQEFKVFTDPNDRRPKKVFICLVEDLHTVSAELKNYLK